MENIELDNIEALILKRTGDTFALERHERAGQE